MAIDTNGGLYLPVAANGADLRLPLPMSWSIWLKLNSSVGSSFGGAWYFSAANAGYLLLFHSAIGLRAYWRDTGGQWRYVGTSLPDVGDWHHFVGTAASGDIEFFVDGSSVGTGGTMNILTYTSPGDFVFGRYSDAALDFSGAEFAIFDKVLTASEIALLGQRITRMPMMIPNLVAYWPLDDLAPGVSSNGKPVKNFSANAHDFAAANSGLGDIFNFSYPRRK